MSGAENCSPDTRLTRGLVQGPADRRLERRENVKRKDVLNEAERAVNGNREEDYGSPESNFEMIARLWSIYLDKGINSKDVAAMMILLKISRIKNGPGKDDNWIDVAGYAACGGELASENSFVEKLKESIDCYCDPKRKPKKLCKDCKYYLDNSPDSICNLCLQYDQLRPNWERKEEKGE